MFGGLFNQNEYARYDGGCGSRSTRGTMEQEECTRIKGDCHQDISLP